ncbi:MAG: hypothetical protein WD512_19335 [Candidatus Paceibacterota bacterium]
MTELEKHLLVDETTTKEELKKACKKIFGNKDQILSDIEVCNYTRAFYYRLPLLYGIRQQLIYIHNYEDRSK